MEIGYKYNLNTEAVPPACTWLTLPNFRMNQQASQSFLDRAQELRTDGYKLHGHPLINLRKHPKGDLESFLAGITSGFHDVIDSWDVINECSNYGTEQWGDYWQAKAFEKMRVLCPNAQLYLNEYAIQNPNYWDGVLELAARLKKEGLLDGIGIQCRADITKKIPKAFDYGASKLLQPLPAPKLTKIIHAVKSLNLACHLSEVVCTYAEGQEQSARAVVKRYAQVGKDNGADRITYWSKDGLNLVTGDS